MTDEEHLQLARAQALLDLKASHPAWAHLLALVDAGRREAFDMWVRLGPKATEEDRAMMRALEVALKGLLDRIDEAIVVGQRIAEELQRSNQAKVQEQILTQDLSTDRELEDIRRAREQVLP